MELLFLIIVVGFAVYLIHPVVAAKQTSSALKEAMFYEKIEDDYVQFFFAREIALGVGLKYVYIGNVVGNPAESSYCPKCNKILIQRIGYSIIKNNIKDGKCKFCGEKIAGIW